MTRDEAVLEIERLSSLLRKYNHQYHVLNQPTVSDLEYDRLFDTLGSLENEHQDLKKPDSPSHRVGSDLTTDLPGSHHSIPVLSLDKAYTSTDIMAWIGKTIKSAGSELSFVVEQKIDGVSIVLYYEEGVLARAVTRGNGYVGNDVTANIQTIRSVPLRLSRDISLAVRGEIYLPVAKFAVLNKAMESPYANPRNLAAGTIRRIRSSEVAAIPLEIFVYEGFMEGATSHLEMLRSLKELGFRTNPRVGYFDANVTPNSREYDFPGLVEGSFENIEEFIRSEVDSRESLSYEIDGLVLKVNEIPVRERLGHTGHHPKWAVAYKFEAPEGVTTLISIDVQVGRTGRITPVGRVKPVLIGGSTISNVTLHNQVYINLLELGIGDTVAVSKRGDVIPALERVIDKNEDGIPIWQMPETCPSCNQSLQILGAHLFCTNRSCPDQIRGKLFFFVGKGQMDIDNLGPETVDVLLEEGLVSRVEDFYTADLDCLVGLPGFGPKKVVAIKRGIEESLKRPFRVVLPSLGLPDLGQKVTQVLIDEGYSNIESIIALVDADNVEALVSIEGVGQKTAERIIAELKSPEVRRTIAALQSAGLEFIEKASTARDSVGPTMEGQNWCVTGSFQNFKPRDLAMEEIIKRGGKTTSQVSGKTTHLLAGPGGGSKLKKAQDLGLQIVSEAEFLKLIGVMR